MNRNHIIFTIFYILTIGMVACRHPDSPLPLTTTTITTTATDGFLIDEEKTETIQDSGGEIKLTDGSTHSLAPENSAEPVNITFSRLIPPEDLAVAFENQVQYQIKGLLAGERATMMVPVPADLPAGSVVGAIAISNLETGDGVELDTTFDAAQHRLSVSLDKIVVSRLAASEGAKGSARGSASWTIVTEWDWDYTPLSDEKVLPMPFYKQSGGCCWGMATLMLAKGYTGDDSAGTIADLLRYVGSPFDDWGIYSTTFMKKVPAYLALRTGLIAESRSYRFKSSLMNRIMKEIDVGHPLILRWPSHAVLVVGYKKVSGQYEPVVHDSKAVNGIVTPPKDGWGARMYSIFNQSWIKNYLSDMTGEMQLVWINGVMPNQRSLQTLMPPLSGEGSGGFIEAECGRLIVGELGNQTFGVVAQVMPDPTSLERHRWVYPGDATKTSLGRIPLDKHTKVLGYTLMLFNTADVDIVRQLAVNVLQGTVSVAGKTHAVAMNKVTNRADQLHDAAKGPYELEDSIELAEFRTPESGDAGGTASFTVKLSLSGGDGFIDGPYYIPLSLSVIPFLETVTPVTAYEGSDITLQGMGFGKTKSSKSAVEIVDSVTGSVENATIKTWSDEKIVATLPNFMAKRQHGVRVITGGTYRYQSADTKNITIETTPPPEITDMSGPTALKDGPPYVYSLTIKNGVPPFRVKASARGSIIADEYFDDRSVSFNFSRAELDKSGNGAGYFMGFTVTDSSSRMASTFYDSSIQYVFYWVFASEKGTYTLPAGL